MQDFLKKAVPSDQKQWTLVIIEVVLFALLIVADLLSKKYISAFLAQNGGSADMIPGFIGLYYTENTGASFGIFSNGTTALIVITSVAMVAVAAYLLLSKKDSPMIRIPLVLVLAGGVGNLIDRIALGYVRDFFNFEFIKFGIFNVADACISVGAVLLVVVLIVDIIKDASKPKKNALPSDDESDMTGD